MLFTGTVRHQDGERPVSVVDGWIRLDTRRLLTSFDGDLHLDSLSFEGIRAGYPTLPSLGSITGQVRLAGTMERMDLDADVHGEIGALRVRGPAVVMPPRWGGDSLQIDFRNLDLRALRGGGPTSDLTGGVFVVGLHRHAPRAGRVDQPARWGRAAWTPSGSTRRRRGSRSATASSRWTPSARTGEAGCWAGGARSAGPSRTRARWS